MTMPTGQYSYEKQMISTLRTSAEKFLFLNKHYSREEKKDIMNQIKAIKRDEILYIVSHPIDEICQNLRDGKDIRGTSAFFKKSILTKNQTS